LIKINEPTIIEFIVIVERSLRKGSVNQSGEEIFMWKKPLFLLVVALTVFTQVGDGAKAGNAERPNILLIVADDLGYSDIGPFGGEISTPALDDLARDGLMLTNFHVLPSCSPTRSVLLSGVDNHLAGLGTMGEIKTPEMEGQSGYAGYLNFQVAALPKVLKAAGYNTYMAGKWHLGDEEKTSPHARGFDETFILVPGGGSHWSDRRPLSPPQKMIYRRNGQIVDSLPDDFYSTKDYTDYLLNWIKEDEGDDKPFFAYLSYTAPHDPLHAPREYIEKYKGTYDKGWDVLRETRLEKLKALGVIPETAPSYPRLGYVEAWNEMPVEMRQEHARDMEVYAAMIDYMDEQIARIINHLKETGEYDNTLILFFSDNGANGAQPTAYPGQTEEFLSSFDNSIENRGLRNSYIEPGAGWAQASMTPFRMFKAFTADGGIRSPSLVKLPGDVENTGSMNHSFFHVRDIMPTLLDAAGIEPPQEIGGRTVFPLQGASVLDLFAGKSQGAYAGADDVGYELFGLKAYFSGQWKILWMPKPFGLSEWELFNLEDDPAELNDLSQTYPEQLQIMIARWERYKVDNRVLDISFDLSVVK
jgi:arylsulfatase A-like enzyme